MTNLLRPRPQTRLTGLLSTVILGLPARRLGSSLRRTLVVASLALALFVPGAEAAVFDASKAWTPDPTTGVTKINICIVEGSTTSEDFVGSFLYSTPSLGQVVARIRNVVNNSWGRASSVWFDGWQPCSQVSNPAEYVGLLIHPSASDNSTEIGTDGLGRLGFSNPGIQIRPWGYPTGFLGYVDLGGSCFTYLDGYGFDCAEQYAIHEFGHVLGFLRELRHPLRPSCSPVPLDFLSQNYLIPPGSWSTSYTPGQTETYFLFDESSYDANSVMAYGPSPCADVTGVRFGSPSPSPTDLAAVEAVYGPPTVTPIFVTSPYLWTPWYDALGELPRRVFETSAENVALAHEVAALPVANQALGTPLTFLATTAGLCSSVTLNALQRPCTYPITYEDTEGGAPFGPGTLSIGDINDCENDDFELTFAPDSVKAFAFTLVDNTVEAGEQITVYGADGQLGNFAMPAAGSDGKVFLGFASDTAITSIRVDENSSGDDIAIRDFELGCTGTHEITYPDLPFNPIAINATTTCASPIVRTIHVPDSFEVGDVRLAFNASHTYRGDIQVTLVSPSGTPVTAISSPGDALGNYDLILDGALDSGPVNSGIADDPAAPYFSRRALPSNPLSAFAGENAVGDWELRICDTYSSADNGTYNRAQLILEPASEIVVTTALDVVDDADGETSLREAMKVAEATSGTVTFDPALAGATLSLSTAAPDVGLGATAFNVQSAIVIDGKDAPDLTLTAATAMRFFFVGGTGSLTLRNLTLSGGDSNLGAVAWVDRGTLSIESATLTSNFASIGGSVAYNNEGIVRLENATLSGNSGAVLANAGSAAALYMDGVTLTGNTSGSESAIFNTNGLVQLANSIVAGNVPSDLCCTVSGSSHHNLIGNPAGASGLVHGVNGNIVGDGLGGILPIATILDSVLADNGGHTPTHALSLGSPALDAGMTDLLVDQRGVPRPQGAAADIGAFEAQPFVVSNANDSGADSLRDAIASSPPGSRIVFDPALSGGTIVLTSGQISIDKDLEIDASALAAGVALDGSGLDRIFTINPGVEANLIGLEIRNGSQSAGGGIYNDGDLTLVDCTLENNQASSWGGGLFNNATATVERCTFSGNTSNSVAGALWNNPSGNLTVINTTVSGNHAAWNGGALLNDRGDVTLIHSTITSNTAGNASGGQGGGLDNDAGTIHLENSIVAGNSALLAATVADVSNRNGGTITSAGANLIGDNTTVGSEFPTGALVGTQASPMDPMLLPLGDNGGPTWTMLPLVDSPAIDAAVGTVASPTTDQRGELRPGNLDDDLGAVEVPEPGFAVGLTAGLALLAVLRRRRGVA